MTFTITIEPPRQNDIEALLRHSTAFARSLYAPENSFLLDIDELETPGTSFYVARDSNGQARGIAALVELGERPCDRAELKRMFVHEDARSRGIARALLARIESDAASRGFNQIVLETGTLHVAALELYRRNGFQETPLFGAYIGEEFSICFGKDLHR